MWLYPPAPRWGTGATQGSALLCLPDWLKEEACLMKETRLEMGRALLRAVESVSHTNLRSSVHYLLLPMNIQWVTFESRLVSTKIPLRRWVKTQFGRYVASTTRCMLDGFPLPRPANVADLQLFLSQSTSLPLTFPLQPHLIATIFTIYWSSNDFIFQARFLT